MKLINGKYANAKVFTDNVENTALKQIQNMVNHELTEKTKVRIMPDCLTDDTEVLTTKGFKLIKELNTDDIIAEYNASTKSITWSVPNNIIVRKLRNNEKVFRFKNNQHNIQIDTTENHRNAIVNKMGIKTKDIKDYIRMKTHPPTILLCKMLEVGVSARASYWIQHKQTITVLPTAHSLYGCSSYLLNTIFS